jgi:archaellin
MNLNYIFEGFSTKYEYDLSNQNLENNKNNTYNKNTIPFRSCFQLPINYLEDKYIHTIPETVIQDLELVSKNTENKGMYEFLIEPSNQFSKQLLDDWKQTYTSNIPFLQDTQNVLRDFHQTTFYKNKKENQCEFNSAEMDENDRIFEIWKETKHNDLFLEKYSFIEWTPLQFLNESPEFLHCMSILNMTSPVVSFFLPLLFLIFPFIILQIQGIPITFSVYLQKLYEISKGHVFGKMFQLDSLSLNSFIYLVASLILYGIQMYQNTVLCMRFYRNIHTINEMLCDIRTDVYNSIKNMDEFVFINQNKSTYQEFCDKTREHSRTLQILYKELETIRPFSPSILKLGEIGKLLKCFYRLHHNPEYECSLLYSFGFQGYLDNLFGIVENLTKSNVNYATFDTKSQCAMQEQYYPVLINKQPIKNNCDLSCNMVITAPNGSGKTTVLKTTMINIIFSQQFGVGFYKSCVINPYTHIYSYLNIPDTSNYDSLFQSEARRCKEILDNIRNYGEQDNCRHFYIFDEIFSGTSPRQAEKLIYSYLKYICKYKNVNFCLTSHHTRACKKLRKISNICNYKMMVIQNADHSIKYTYKMKKGISFVEGSLSVLKQLDYPVEIIDDIRSNLQNNENEYTKI